jgi:hypothetical protein
MKSTAPSVINDAPSMLSARASNALSRQSLLRQPGTPFALVSRNLTNIKPSKQKNSVALHSTRFFGASKRRKKMLRKIRSASVRESETVIEADGITAIELTTVIENPATDMLRHPIVTVLTPAVAGLAALPNPTPTKQIVAKHRLIANASIAKLAFLASHPHHLYPRAVTVETVMTADYSIGAPNVTATVIATDLETGTVIVIEMVVLATMSESVGSVKKSERDCTVPVVIRVAIVTSWTTGRRGAQLGVCGGGEGWIVTARAWEVLVDGRLSAAGGRGRRGTIEAQ